MTEEIKKLVDEDVEDILCKMHRLGRMAIMYAKMVRHAAWELYYGDTRMDTRTIAAIFGEDVDTIRKWIDEEEKNI